MTKQQSKMEISPGLKAVALAAAFLVIFLPVRADIEWATSIEDVFYRGTNELAGSVTLTINDDDFVSASPEAPIFLRISTSSGARLAKTLVDQSLPTTDYRAFPIYLAMAVTDLDDAVTLTAPADTVSIVRWVAGEPHIWLRVQRSSATWIGNGKTTFSPNESYKVTFSLGISARESAEAMAQVDAGDRNLPFNTRFPDTAGHPDDAVSSNYCLDLSESTLGFTGIESLLEIDYLGFGPGSDQGNGVYDDSDPLPWVYFWPGAYIARGKDRSITATRLASPFSPRQMVGRDELQSISLEIPLSLDSARGSDYLEMTLGEGSGIALTCTEGSMGFESGALRLLSQDRAATIRPRQWDMVALSMPFRLAGKTLYRRAELIWTREPQSLDALVLRIGVTVTAAKSVSTIPVEMEVNLAGDAKTLDSPPYDGIDQQPGCGGGPFSVYRERFVLYEHVRRIAHVTRTGGGFSTELIVGNTAVEDASIILTAFDERGAMLGEAARTVFPEATETFAIADLFDDEEVAHLEVSGSPEVSVAAIYRAFEKEAVPCQIWADGETSRLWTLSLGEKALTFDGLAVINTEETPTAIVARFRDFAGKLLAETPLTDALAGGAKGLYNLSRLAPDGSASVEISAEAELAVTALRGDYQATFLWANQAVRSQ